MNGGLLGKGTDIPAPGKKDHWVRKVGRGMTAAAANLGLRLAEEAGGSGNVIFLLGYSDTSASI